MINVIRVIRGFAIMGGTVALLVGPATWLSSFNVHYAMAWIILCALTPVAFLLGWLWEDTSGRA